MNIQENEKIIRVNRKTARRLYEAGKTIYLLPCKMRIDNHWTEPAPANIETDGHGNFEKLENAYSYYNCNNEVGRYIAFFAEKKDLQDKNNTINNFAFCLVIEDPEAVNMTVQDASYNITEWKKEQIILPRNMTAPALVKALHNVARYIKGDN